MPPEKEVEIVNHLKTLAPKVKDSDIDRLLSEDFADLMKQKHSGNFSDKSKRFNRAEYIAQRIGRSEGYIKNRIALFQKKMKYKKYTSGELEITSTQKDGLRPILRKYRKAAEEHRKISEELSELKSKIKEITDLPISYLIDLQSKGKL